MVKNIETCEKLQEEIRCFTEYLEQMQLNAINTCEALKQLEVKIIVNKAYKEFADEISEELSRLFSWEQSILIKAKIREVLAKKIGE